MKSKTIKGASVQELKTALAGATSDGYKPTLAIVFASIAQDLEGINNLLTDHGIDSYGVTTAGEFINKEIEENSAVMMLMDMKRSNYNIIPMETGDKDILALATDTANQAKSSFSNPAFIVSMSGLTNDGEQIINGIESVIGSEAQIFGGISGDDFTMTGNFVFTNNNMIGSGLLTLALDTDNIDIKGLATSGWKPVGTDKIITKSVGNVVYTIDDKPALDTFVAYFGLEDMINNDSAVIQNIGCEFPLQVRREGEKESIMRAPLMANKEDNSLVCAGSVPQGATVQFSMPPGFDIIDKVIAETNMVKEELPVADALIMYSCKARHLSLGPLIEDEIGGIQEVWGAPLIGFFSYGEIGKTVTGKSDFHNNTCSLIALHEKN